MQKNTVPPGSQWQVQTHPFLRHLSSWFPEHYLRTAEAKTSDEKPIKEWPPNITLNLLRL